MNDFYGIAPCDQFFESWYEAEENRRLSRELMKEEVKTEMRKNARLEVMRKKSLLKEEEAERKRALYEMVEIRDDGRVVAVTRNLRITAEPRVLTNVRHPKFLILRNLACEREFAYEFGGKIGDEERQVLIHPEKMMNGNYLLGRLARIGGNIFAPPGKEKPYAIRLFSLLAKGGTEVWLPERAGWNMGPDGTFFFTGEEEQTWEKVAAELF